MTVELQEKKPFTEHLDDLRKLIVRSVIYVIVGGTAAIFFNEPLLAFLCRPILEQKVQLHYFSPADAMVIKLQVAVLAGVIVVSPFIAREFWRFVAPGLFTTERKKLLPWISLSVILFALGTVFAYAVVLPMGLRCLLEFGTFYLTPMIGITQYLSFVGSTILAFGFAFNLPVAIVAVVQMKMVDIKTLEKYRRHAYVAVFIIGAVLTPPDVMSQLLLSIPMLLLYESGILAAKLLCRNKGKK